MHALKQQCNWIPFITLKAEIDPHQEKKLMELRMKKNTDELLRVMSKFMHVSDGEVTISRTLFTCCIQLLK